MEKRVFFCECGYNEHQMVVETFDDDPAIYVSVCLSDSRCFLQRLKLAIKYVFGYKSKHGMFAEMILDSKDANRMIEILKSKIQLTTPDVPN
jgi:hypothetical protein